MALRREVAAWPTRESYRNVFAWPTLDRRGNTQPRFECVQEPTGTWAVIDSQTGKPAKLDGKLLVGRDRPNAEAACLELGKIYQKGLEHKSERQWTECAF